jgi:replication factor C small subunit
MKYKNYLWPEKYRPQRVSEIILPKKIRTFIESVISDGQIPNMLFYSTSPGSGKTTTAKAICEDLGCEVLYINTSSERGIDVLRNDVNKFATFKSIHNKPKVVILDEFDGSSLAFQDALRASIERFSNTCRFIFTCNNVNKIIDPIRSRCEGGLIDFNVSDEKTKSELKPKIVKRLVSILKFEKVEYKLETIEKIVDSLYPDIRKMIGLLQRYSKDNSLINDNIFSYDGVDSEFFDFVLNKKLGKARKYLIDNKSDYSTLYTILYRDLLPLMDKEIQPQIILDIAEYQYRDSFSLDKEINFIACLIEIMEKL